MDKILKMLNTYSSEWSDGSGGGECIYSGDYTDLAQEIYALQCEILEPLQLLCSRLSSDGNYTICKKDDSVFSLGESLDLCNIMAKIGIWVESNE